MTRPKASIILDEKLKAFPLRPDQEQERMPTLTISIQYNTESPR